MTKHGERILTRGVLPHLNSARRMDLLLNKKSLVSHVPRIFTLTALGIQVDATGFIVQ